jgi:hypothetical protein
MATATLETVSALEIQDGDIIFIAAYRVRVSDCIRTTDEYGIERNEFTLHSEPSIEYPKPLPQMFERMQSAGNQLRKIAREVA